MLLTVTPLLSVDLVADTLLDPALETMVIVRVVRHVPAGLADDVVLGTVR